MNLNIIFSLTIPFLLSFIMVCIIMPFWISFLKKKDANQEVSEYALEQFQKKAKTPTFGGFIFIIVTLVITIIYGLITHTLDQLMLLLGSLFLFGLIGFIDDYIIVMQHNNAGLSPKAKLYLQIGFACLLVFGSLMQMDTTVQLFSLQINLSLLYIPFMAFIFVGSSNAVNLTDGMDGLAAGCSLIVALGFLAIALHQGACASIVFFIMVLAGSLVGYLIFNHYPAKIFMGDTGSLALGGVFAALAVILQQELAYVIIGGIFVVETLCCMLQIFWVKRFKKRLFIYTPIHYAFTKNGWKETDTVLLFYFMCFIFVILGVMIAFAS